MVNLGFSWGGFSIANQMEKVTSDIKSKVESSCDSGGTTVQSGGNSDVQIQDSACQNINIGNQSITYTSSCVAQYTQAAVNSALTKQISGGVQSGSNTQVKVFGTSISNNMTNISQKVSQAIKNTCGNGNTKVQTYKNVKLDLSGDSECGLVNFYNQNATSNVQCMLGGYQDALNKNKVLQDGGSFLKGTPGIITICVLGAIVIAIFGVVIHAVVKHKQKKDTIQKKKARRGSTSGSSSSGGIEMTSTKTTSTKTTSKTASTTPNASTKTTSKTASTTPNASALHIPISQIKTMVAANPDAVKKVKSVMSHNIPSSVAKAATAVIRTATPAAPDV